MCLYVLIYYLPVPNNFQHIFHSLFLKNRRPWESEDNFYQYIQKNNRAADARSAKVVCGFDNKMLSMTRNQICEKFGPKQCGELAFHSCLDNTVTVQGLSTSSLSQIDALLLNS